MNAVLRLLIFLPCLAAAQESNGYHQHDGLFLSLSGGPAFGPITLAASGQSFKKMEYTGAGGMLDVKLGWTLARTVSLSADFMKRTIFDPEEELDGRKPPFSNEVSASDQLMGAGITYYFMPFNVFVSGTLGVAKFTFKNDARDINASSQSGFGVSLKAGKEWWVASDWGLGVSAGFATGIADDKEDPLTPSYSGKLSTSKLFVLFTTTYN